MRDIEFLSLFYKHFSRCQHFAFNLGPTRHVSERRGKKNEASNNSTMKGLVNSATYMQYLYTKLVLVRLPVTGKKSKNFISNTCTLLFSLLFFRETVSIS
jgi:hypothetical protein